MAIARDAVAASTGTDTDFNLTFAHDCGSGADRFLIVAIHTSADDITGVTYAGVAMVLLDKSSDGVSQLWGLHNPAAGSNNVSITNNGFHRMSAVAQCYTGVQQSTTPDAVSGSTDTAIFATSLTMSTTTVADNCWVFFAVRCANTASLPSAGTGSSLVGQHQPASAESISLFDTNGAVTPAGSRSMQVTHGSSTNLSGAQVSLAPAAGGGGGGGGLLIHPGMTGGMKDMSGGIRGYRRIPRWARHIPETTAHLKRAA